jgi:hypothetical protein
MNRIVDSFIEKLRADPATFPNVQQLTEVQLRDHLPAWLADAAQSLITLEAVTGDLSELMRDGSEIQRVICERHGAQRHRLGWGEMAVSREFRVVEEVIEETLTSRGVPAEVSVKSRSILAGLVRQADETSLRGLRQAARMEPVEPRLTQAMT